MHPICGVDLSCFAGLAQPQRVESPFESFTHDAIQATAILIPQACTSLTLMIIDFDLYKRRLYPKLVICSRAHLKRV
jgi:hypothetical protein